MTIEVNKVDVGDNITVIEPTKPIDTYFKVPVMQRLISKKFITVLTTVITITIMVVMGKITGEMFADLLTALIPSYLAADGVQNLGINLSENRSRKSVISVKHEHNVAPESVDLLQRAGASITVDEVTPIVDKIDLSEIRPDHKPISEQLRPNKKIRLKPRKV